MKSEVGTRKSELKRRLAKMRDDRELSSGFYSVTVTELLELLGICEGILDLVGTQHHGTDHDHEREQEAAAR